MRLDEISRLHILFLVLRQHLTSLGKVKGQISAKNDVSPLHAHSDEPMRRSDLEPWPTCSPFNYEQYRVSLQKIIFEFRTSRNPDCHKSTPGISAQPRSLAWGLWRHWFDLDPTWTKKSSGGCWNGLYRFSNSRPQETTQLPSKCTRSFQINRGHWSDFDL